MSKEFQEMGEIVWNEVKNIETKYSKLKMMQFMAKYYSSDAKEDIMIMYLLYRGQECKITNVFSEFMLKWSPSGQGLP